MSKKPEDKPAASSGAEAPAHGSGKGSPHASAHGSAKGSSHPSAHPSAKGSTHPSAHPSAKGSTHPEQAASAKGNEEAAKPAEGAEPANAEGEPKDSPKSPDGSPAAEAAAEAAHHARRKGEKVELTNCHVGFLGAGKMTEAIVKGLMKYTKIEASRIFVASPHGARHDIFKQMGCKTSRKAYDIFKHFGCEVIFFAFNGDVIRHLYSAGGTQPRALCTNYIPRVAHPYFMLSLAGGIPLGDIKKTLVNPDYPDKYKISMHRVMLNASVAYGIGLGVLDVEPDSKKCSPLIRDLLATLAKVEHMPEASIDVACAIGGQGLAFAYYFITALADGGNKIGLPKNVAVKLATKTLQSAAASLLQSGKLPSELRDECVSPSGPAIYGMHVLDKQEAGAGMGAAVETAFKRIRELAKGHGSHHPSPSSHTPHA